MSESKFITDAALHAIRLAGQETRRYQGEQVSVLHLLLGLTMLPDELAGRVLHELKVEPNRVHQLMRRLTGSETYAGIQAVIEGANGAADRMGDNYVGTEHLLLALLDNPDGRKAITQLGLSPEHVRNRLVALWRQQSAPVPEDQELDLATLPSGAPLTRQLIPDIAKLVVESRFPIRTVLDPVLPYRLCRVGYELRQQAKRGFVDCVSFELAHPICAVTRNNWYDNRWVRVDNWREKAEGERHSHSALEAVGQNVLDDDVLRLPSVFGGLLGQRMPVSASSAPQYYLRWQELLADPRWESVDASGLHFTAAYWTEGQMPVGWAHSRDASPVVVIATLGVERSAFFGILGSLVVIDTRDDVLVKRLQEELETARHEFDRNRDM